MKTNYFPCTGLNCRKTFRNEESLSKHLKADHSENENNSLIGYRCKKCRKILGTKQCLKEHIYTHTGQKPYRCSELGCGKAFRQSSQLSYHKKLHSELKRFIRKESGDSGKNDLTNGKFNHGVPDNSFYQFENFKLPEISSPAFNVKLPNLFA